LGERGAALVEFALVVVLLLPLLLAIVEFGRAWFTVHVIQSAAREGARVCAMSMGSYELRIQEATRRMDTVLDVAGLENTRFAFSDTMAWGFGHPIQVEVFQPFTSIAGPILPALQGGLELKGSAVFNQELPKLP
jgi:hypothetical protein